MLGPGTSQQFAAAAFWSLSERSGHYSAALFVPLRTVRIFPSAVTAMMVASLAIAAGAADSALLISSSSLRGAAA